MCIIAIQRARDLENSLSDDKREDISILREHIKSLETNLKSNKNSREERDSLI